MFLNLKNTLFLAVFGIHLQSRWKQQVSPKRLSVSSRLHDVTSQGTVFFLVFANYCVFQMVFKRGVSARVETVGVWQEIFIRVCDMKLVIYTLLLLLLKIIIICIRQWSVSSNSFEFLREVEFLYGTASWVFKVCFSWYAIFVSKYLQLNNILMAFPFF